MFNNKRIVVFGGAGSVGKELVFRILRERRAWDGSTTHVTVFSRDEQKHHAMKSQLGWAANGSEKQVEFVVGDVSNLLKVRNVIRTANIVVFAAAMKHVDACENNPDEAIDTNVDGTRIITSLLKLNNPEARTLWMGTDKAANPAGVYGETKHLQERLFQTSGLNCVGVRFGNIVPSSGSVIPMFRELAKAGKDLPVTCEDMTRFFVPMKTVIDTIIDALWRAPARTITIPRMVSARIGDVADFYCERYGVKKHIIGLRPAEKSHELLISPDELPRCNPLGDYWVVHPREDAAMASGVKPPANTDHDMLTFSSAYGVMAKKTTATFLEICGQA